MATQRRKLKYRYLVIALLVAVGAGVYAFRRSGGEEPIIRTAVVERGTVASSISANGVLEPLTTVELKSNVGGQVIELAVDEGDVVRPGQLIARIDPSDTLAAYEQSQADVAAAVSRVDQAREQLAMQRVKSVADVDSARQALASARARLAQAQEQAKVQPKLTSSAISQAKSSLAAAESSLKQTRNALVPQQLASAQSAYDSAKASYDAAAKDHTRHTELLAKGFVSRSQVDVSEEKYNVAKAQVESARRKLDTVKDETDESVRSAQARVEQSKAELANAQANSVQNNIRKQELTAARAAVKQAEAALQSTKAATRENRVREGDIIQANAQVERSQSELRNTQTQLGYTTIVAPRAGIVTKKYVEEGSIVTAGRSSFSGTGSGVAIVDIADTSRMFVEVSVDETDIAQVRVGQEVDVLVEAYMDVPFKGRVTKIAPQSVTEQNVTTVPVTVEVGGADARLKPGMNATCDFIIARVRDTLRVPSEAVAENDSGSTVTVLEGDRQVERKVETGLVGTETTQIKSGLREGQKVVTAVIDLGENGGSSGPGGQSGGRSGGQQGGGGRPPGMMGPR